MKTIERITGGLLACLATVALAQPVFADRFTSPNYTIDASTIGNTFGGSQTSANYALVSSGGESVIGNGTSGSYKLGEGYVAQLDRAMELTLDNATINLGTVTPGTSKTANLVASVRTDAPGYVLGVNQNHDLQFGAYTIPGVSGSIGSPVTWSESSTKGLGFSLVSTNATAIPGKWSAGASYAAFPSSSTTFYSRSGYTGGATDTLTMRVRLDTQSSQVGGAYTNTVTWVGTTNP